MKMQPFLATRLSARHQAGWTGCGDRELSAITGRKRSSINCFFKGAPILKRDAGGKTLTRLAILLGLVCLFGCEDLVIRDTSSLLLPRFQRSEVVGVVAGFGTTFAAFPDLIKMLKRRSSKGINPTMAGIMGVFQILWVYYGLLIESRPVVAWNAVAVVINSLTVWAYFQFSRKEKQQGTE